MGSFCCCFLAGKREGHSNANGSNSLIHNVMNQYGSILDEEEEETPDVSPPNNEGMMSSPRVGMCTSPIRPSSVDPDPGIPSLQRSEQPGSLVPERSAANPQQNLEPSKKSSLDKDKELEFKETCIVGLQECQSESSASKIGSSILYVYSAADDEDVCPTCLVEYTAENPKIVAKCNHDFHLACIFEWMERSECCPVCGKLMMFDETM